MKLDTNQFDQEIISLLAGEYMHAQMLFGDDWSQSSKKKQVRKWFHKRFSKSHETIKNLFDKQYSDDEVLNFLDHCYKSQQNYMNERQSKLQQDFKQYDTQIISALEAVLDLEMWNAFQLKGNDLYLSLDDNDAYQRTLILKNVKNIPTLSTDYYGYEMDVFYSDIDQSYHFIGKLFDGASEDELLMDIIFEDLELKIDVFNACNQALFSGPWNYLIDICVDLCEKTKIGIAYHENELEVLDLIHEVDSLSITSKCDEHQSYDHLKAFAKQFSLDKIIALLGQLEEHPHNGNKKLKLQAMMNKKENAPLWRCIYQKLKASQENYPNKTDQYPLEELKEYRHQIQNFMEEHGYQGSYPNYYKEGSLKGMRVDHAHGLSYLIINEKYVRHHIQCIECLDASNQLSLQFVCGMVFLNDFSEQSDIYDCLFDSKGRNFYHLVQVDDLSILQEQLVIAMKKAESIRLTKEEKDLFYGSENTALDIFLWNLIVVGGIFGVVMTLVLIMTAAISISFEVGFSMDLLLVFPWIIIFIISWLLFGTLMGIVEVFVHRK